MAVLKLLDLNFFTKNLKKITNIEYMTTTGDFHTEGLFSETIFGIEGSLDRRRTFAYIDLGTKVVHPTAYKFLTRLDRKVIKFINAEENFILDKNKNLVISDDGVTGITEFILIFPKIEFRGETPDRIKMIKVLKDSYKNNTLFIDKIPVIPPDLRPLFKDEAGNITVDALNDYYTTIMRRASQVQGAAGSGPLFDLLVAGLQKAVIDHDVYIKSKIAKKPGIIRKNLLGKRIDFSGRAVITPDPALKINEMGVPFRLAVTLFEPFLLHVLLKTNHVDRVKLNEEIINYIGVELSVDVIKKLIKGIRTGDKLPKSLYDIFFEATKIAIEGRVILAKRDPVLHSESVRSYYPVLMEGDTLRMCTMQVGGHNADFDGDQMAVYHPITNEAQEEAKERLMNAKAPSSAKNITFELSKEMFSGLYIMSKEVPMKTPPRQIMDRSELERAVDPFLPVIFKGTKTTMGRAIINSCFPINFPFVNKQFDKKLTNKIIAKLFELYSDDIIREVVSRLEKFAFKFATIGAASITLDQLELPPEILKLKEKLKTASPEESGDIIDEMKKILVKHMEGKGFYDIIESGSGKGWHQPSQILLAKGVVEDPEGNVLEPIPHSFADGLSPKEYFNASYGARKGICDRGISTADTGYMTRKLLFVCSPVEADPYTKDCGTKRVLNLKLTNDLISRLNGRFIIDSKGRLVEFRPEDFKAGQIINLRSPIYCRSQKVCQVCYGKLLKTLQSPYVGVHAAFVIGERGTSLVLTSFHKGGTVSISKQDILSDIVNNDPLINFSVGSYLQQNINDLKCKEDCILSINKSDYENEDNLRIDEDKIWVSSLVSDIEFSNVSFKIVLDYPVNIYIKKGNIKNNNETINIKYKSGDDILNVISDTNQMKKQIHYVERLISGKEVYKDVEHLLLKLYKVYASNSNFDFVHFEVLISQCLRDRSNNTLPARLGKTWNPKLINMKKIVLNSGFINSLCFENINNAIQTGLIGGETLEPSIIEKVLTGSLVEKKKR